MLPSDRETGRGVQGVQSRAPWFVIRILPVFILFFTSSSYVGDSTLKFLKTLEKLFLFCEAHWVPEMRYIRLIYYYYYYYYYYYWIVLMLNKIDLKPWWSILQRYSTNKVWLVSCLPTGTKHLPEIPESKNTDLLLHAVVLNQFPSKMYFSNSQMFK